MSAPAAVPAPPRRVLLVEDEMMIAMMMEDMLADIGHELAGVAQNLDAAMQMAAERDFDLAILDINLAGERSFPVARILADRGVPFMFATGYGQLGLEAPFEGTYTLKKPFQIQDLAKAIDRVCPA